MGSTFLNGEVGGYPGSLGGVHYKNNGNIEWYASGDQSTSTGTTFTGGSVDKIGMALDCDNTKIYWYKNNVLVNSGGFDYSVCTASFTELIGILEMVFLLQQQQEQLLMLMVKDCLLMLHQQGIMH